MLKNIMPINAIKKFFVKSNIFIANCDYDKKTYNEYIGQILKYEEFKKIFPYYNPQKMIKKI